MTESQKCACSIGTRDLKPRESCPRCGACVTPEGFWLSRTILLPDARSFADLLEYVSEWENTDSGYPDPPRPEPRYLPETTPSDATAWERTAWRGDGRNEIGPYCTVDLSQLGGPRHRSIAARATDAVIEAVRPRIVTPDDHLSFRIIGHKDRGRALVTLEHSYIIGSHWLAYIDPETIPPYPYVERDAKIDATCKAIRETEGDHIPYRRSLPDGDIEISCRTIPTIRATFHTDGSVDRTWSDGSTHFEPADGCTPTPKRKEAAR